eukprot:gene7645-10327_t
MVSVGTGWFKDDPIYTIEIGDLCVGNYGALADGQSWSIQVNLKRFLVTEMWVPGYGCAMKLPPGNAGSKKPPTSQPANMPTIAPNMAFDLTYHYRE